MIFNFGRSLTCCTWVVFLISSYACNSFWSECSWWASIRLPVGNEDTSPMLTPAFLLHIKNVYSVISLDSFGKQTKLVKSVFWSHLCQLIVILPIFFSYHAVHILERHNPGLSNQNPWNRWYWAEGALMSCNRTEEDEGEWDRTGVSTLEDLTKTRALVADATQWLPWEENQIPGHSVFK